MKLGDGVCNGSSFVYEIRQATGTRMDILALQSRAQRPALNRRLSADVMPCY
jgi:hypothetical protein